MLAVLWLFAGCVTPGATSEPSANGGQNQSATAAAPSASPALAAPNPTPTPKPTPPPQPGAPTFELVKETQIRVGEFKDEYRITWTEPEGAADSFQIYGMTSCLRESEKNHGTPCVTRGMKIAMDKLDLLATVPGDKRTTKVSWTTNEVPVGPYYAILIRARGPGGSSIFTIVNSDEVCWGCTY